MNDAQSIVQNAYACFGRGDIPAMLALMTPEVVWDFHGDSGTPYSRRVTGHAAVAQWFSQVVEHDDIQSFEPREFLAGPDHVTVIGRERTRARASGKVFDADWVHVWKVKGGRITHFWGLFDTEAAAKARST